jgi:hypothetical protein
MYENASNKWSNHSTWRPNWAKKHLKRIHSWTKKISRNSWRRKRKSEAANQSSSMWRNKKSTSWSTSTRQISHHRHRTLSTRGGQTCWISSKQQRHICLVIEWSRRSPQRHNWAQTRHQSKNQTQKVEVKKTSRRQSSGNQSWSSKIAWCKSYKKSPIHNLASKHSYGQEEEWKMVDVHRFHISQ